MKIDFEQLILAEHSKLQANKIKQAVLDHPDQMKDFMRAFFNGEPKIVQRAAWPLSLIAEENPQLIRPYFGKLMKLLHDESQHPAIPRNITRLFQFVTLPEKYQGELMDYCFKSILDLKAADAVKASAITILDNLCKIYPEIRSELVTALETQFQYEGPAYQSRARKVLQNSRR
ncbi:MULTISPECIES: hypothetical protein [unclassified Paraflavitalea]|uniref:hypothetical protein n=1 Tax=unclassified Paraflavitalea TaxID=2798305 RepID=UPI003D3512FE